MRCAMQVSACVPVCAQTASKFRAVWRQALKWPVRPNREAAEFRAPSGGRTYDAGAAQITFRHNHFNYGVIFNLPVP
jgi:hypothetical protein